MLGKSDVEHLHRQPIHRRVLVQLAGQGDEGRDVGAGLDLERESGC